MEIPEVIKVLEHANKWRRDNSGKYEMPDVKILGIATDVAVRKLKTMVSSSDVSNCDIEGCNQSVEYKLCEIHFDEMNRSGC